MTERIWELLDDAIEQLTNREGAAPPDPHIPFVSAEWNRVVIDIQGRELRETETWKAVLLPALRTGAVAAAWRFADSPVAAPQLLHFRHWHKVENKEHATRPLQAMARDVRKSGRIRADGHPREIQILVDATEVDALLVTSVQREVEPEATSGIRLLGYTSEQVERFHTWLLAWPYVWKPRGDSWRNEAVAAAREDLKDINVTFALLKDVIRQYRDVRASARPQNPSGRPEAPREQRGKGP